MKKILLNIFLFTGLLLVWSCEEESNMEPVGNWELSSPVPQSPASGESIALEASAPSAPVTFNWQAAKASNRFVVAYKVYLVRADANDTSDPLMVLTPGNNARDLTASVSAVDLDYALAVACYPANEVANVKWIVQAQAIDKTTTASSPFGVKRFATNQAPSELYITGSATETGDDATKAIAMRPLTNADGDPTGVFDVYTQLTAGGTFYFRDQATTTSRKFGVAENVITLCAQPIAVSETAVYRVKVDLNTNTYTLWKVEKWSLVGDAVEGGWGGDVPLEYKGGGVFESTVDFLSANAGWIFRANGDWSYIMKRVVGTVAPDGMSGSVYMESEAGDAGVEIEDLRFDDSGKFVVTLDLSSDAHTFSIVPVPVDPGTNLAIIGLSENLTADAVSGNFVFGQYEVPSELYLVSDGTMVAELTKDGNVFTSKFLALEASKKYILNSAPDGSGTTFNNIGDGTISVDHDQAYTLTVDFESGKLKWKHYNMKLFHWDENGGGWDARTETVMTYIHPYKFEADGVELHASYASKFNSPWEVQFGTADSALSGTMTNGGDNFFGIVQDGTYHTEITVNDTFTEAEYSFVIQ